MQGFRGLWLELMEKINGSLCMGCGLEDRPVVVLQNREAGSDIRSVVFANLGGKLKVCAKECSAQFRNKFIAGVSFVAPRLPPEVTFDTRGVLRPMDLLVYPRFA